MNNIKLKIEKILKTFPEGCNDHLLWMINHGGTLSSPACKDIMDIMEIRLEELMVRMLPLARLYASAPVSNFFVGSVVKGILGKNENDYGLFLGANFEFSGQALNQSIHAEQAGTINAWQKGVIRIQCIAVSASPCGHCRQFLNELEGSDSIRIILPEKIDEGYRVSSLPELLPDGFGPHDLGEETGLMGGEPQHMKIDLKTGENDPMVNEALDVANRSYAPYSGNFAGCAIQDDSQEIYSGKYAENAAFNPGLSPLQAAVCIMNMNNIVKRPVIKRVVLVEKKTAVSQYHTSRHLLKSIAPHVNLEYFTVE